MNPSNPIVACQSKRFFISKIDAEDTATYLFYEKDLNLSVYHCNICDGWHLSSKK